MEIILLGTKRSLNSNEMSPVQSKILKTDEATDQDITDLTNEDEAQSNEELLIAVPEISMIESRPDSNSTKSRDGHDNSSPNLRISSSQSLNIFGGQFDFQNESLQLTESPNKPSSILDVNSASGSNITMLSSTSLLHGNCIFNRNNTVATQQGLKTYWLCKSYRISMCKARCITHQGKVISATGVHNHLPHMNNKQEIPPGYTPNLCNPPPVNEFQSIPSSSHHLHNNPAQQLIMAQSYHPYLHPGIAQHENHHHEHMTRLSSIQMQPQEGHDSKLTFGHTESGSSNPSQVKFEHI